MLATSNEDKPISNPDDERRFMPFYCTLPKHKALVFDQKYWNKDIRDQVLAEAMEYYHSGYQFSAPFAPKLQRQWEALIGKASLDNDYFGIVQDYVENKFEKGLMSLEFGEMKYHWRNKPDDDPTRRERRSEFSVKEIYCLALDKRIGDRMDFIIRKEIEQSLETLGFVKVDSRRKSFGAFGQQHYYKLDLETLKDYWLKRDEDERRDKIKELESLKKKSGLLEEEVELLGLLKESVLAF